MNTYYAKLENGTTLKVSDQRDDVQVIINSVVLGPSERWFTVHNSIDETFLEASKRVVIKLSEEKRSPVKIEFLC